MARPVERPEASVSSSVVAAFRWRQHGLDARRPAAQLGAALEAMGGAQAQLASAAELSVAIRLEGLRREDLQGALDRDRRLVRAWCLRQTLYLLPTDRFAVFGRGSAGRSDRDVTWVRRRGVGPQALDTLLGAIVEALAEPRTGPELVRAVAAALGAKEVVRAGYGWGSEGPIPAVRYRRIDFPARFLVHLANARTPICIAPPRDGRTSFVRADTGLPGFRDLPRERAEEELLRIYLRAFGPAHGRDFAWWTGNLQRPVDGIWERVGPEIAPVDVDGARAFVLRRDLDALREARAADDLRLLPYFDSFVLGHRERPHLVASDHADRVYRPQGWVAPVMAVGGRAIGTWDYRVARGRLDVRTRPFRRGDRRPTAEVRREAARIAEYLEVPLGRVEVP